MPAVKFTEKEISFMIENHLFGSKYVAEHLGRGIRSVNHKMRELKLITQTKHHNEIDVCCDTDDYFMRMNKIEDMLHGRLKPDKPFNELVSERNALSVKLNSFLRVSLEDRLIEQNLKRFKITD